MSLPNKIQNTDLETGLRIRKEHLSKSGFNYINGIREFGDLRIVEVIAKGNTTIILSSVMVYDKHQNLIYEISLQQRTFYSREKVRQIVLEGLMEMLRDSCEQEGKSFDELEAYETLDRKLKATYYETSYKAILNWAVNIGISIY